MKMLDIEMNSVSVNLVRTAVRPNCTSKHVFRNTIYAGEWNLPSSSSFVNKITCTKCNMLLKKHLTVFSAMNFRLSADSNH
jgi:hypothetical protein